MKENYNKVIIHDMRHFGHKKDMAEIKEFLKVYN